MDKKLVLTSLLALGFATPAFADFCPSGFSASDPDATVTAQCYKSCTVNDIPEEYRAHAATATGNNYYNYGADTCEPETCVTGWHIVPSVDVDVAATIGNAIGENSAYITVGERWECTGGSTDSGSHVTVDSGGCIIDPNYWGGVEPDPGLWWVNYGPSHGILLGRGRLSHVAGDVMFGSYSNASNPTIKKTSELGGFEVGSTTNGNHCYCGFIKYNPFSDSAGPENSPWYAIESDWVYAGTTYNGTLEVCLSMCSALMHNPVGDSKYFESRQAVLNSVPVFVPTHCDANIVNIEWRGTDPNEVTVNNAWSATYGGDINTPRSAKTVPGKRFKGWQFSATQ